MGLFLCISHLILLIINIILVRVFVIYYYEQIKDIQGI